MLTVDLLLWIVCAPAGLSLIHILHAEVPADGDMNELHDVIDTIEQRLKTELHCHAVIHMDPLDTNDSLVGETRLKVQDAVRAALDAPVSIHDFRMVTGPTHTNVIFDAVIPNELSISDEPVSYTHLDVYKRQ